MGFAGQIARIGFPPDDGDGVGNASVLVPLPTGRRCSNSDDGTKEKRAEGHGFLMIGVETLRSKNHSDSGIFDFRSVSE